MNLVILEKCPACGKSSAAEFSACSNNCVRASATDFIDASISNDAPKFHLHVTCGTCDFVYLSPMSDVRETARAW